MQVETSEPPISWRSVLQTDQDAPDENSKAADEQNCPGKHRACRQHEADGSGECDDTEDCRGQPPVVDEQPEQFAQSGSDSAHRGCLREDGTSEARLSDKTRKSAMKTGIAKSPPGQAMPMPSPVQNTPNAQSIT